MSNLIDLTGKKFGRLTVMQLTTSDALGRSMWICQCTCGNIITVKCTGLTTGTTRSCGCLSIESSKHTYKTILSKHQQKVLVEGTNLDHIKLAKKSQRNSKSGSVGVFWNKRINRWIAFLSVSGDRKNLGCFLNKNDAVGARVAAEAFYFKPILDKYKDK